MREVFGLETPLCAQGSYTVEASIVLPLFICVMAMCIFFSQMIAIQWGVSHALEETVKEAARLSDEVLSTESDEGSDGTSLKKALTYGAFVYTCNSKLKSTNVPYGYITGGLLGLNYSQTEISAWEIKGKVSYYITLPVPLIGSHGGVFTAESTARRWVGWNPSESGVDSGDYVYITASGVAYHKNVHCVYLDPHMYSVSAASVEASRNASGSKYQACAVCHPSLSAGGSVFLSDYGTVYHSTLTCQSLKRTISRVKLEEAVNGGRHACPKCGG